MTYRQLTYYLDAIAEQEHSQFNQRAVLAGVSPDELTDYESSLEEDEDTAYQWIEAELDAAADAPKPGHNSPFVHRIDNS